MTIHIPEIIAGFGFIAIGLWFWYIATFSKVPARRCVRFWLSVTAIVTGFENLFDGVLPWHDPWYLQQAFAWAKAIIVVRCCWVLHRALDVVTVNVEET